MDTFGVAWFSYYIGSCLFAMIENAKCFYCFDSLKYLSKKDVIIHFNVVCRLTF